MLDSRLDREAAIDYLKITKILYMTATNCIPSLSLAKPNRKREKESMPFVGSYLKLSTYALIV